MKSKIVPYSKKIFELIARRKNVVLLTFLAILGIDLYLRFWQYPNTFSFGWDQARDGWKVRDLLHGTLVLDGPRTGVGHFRLSALWFYFLAPFYRLTNLDPMGSAYANIVVSIFNSATLFIVSKKIFGSGYALLASYVLAINGYLISIMKIPWNVSPVIGVSVLIFFCIYRIVVFENYRLIFLLMLLTGFFINLHFSIVFLPPIIVLSLVLAKNKTKTVKYLFLSLPFFLIWFVPLIFLDLKWSGDNSEMFLRFTREYMIDGFHFQFFIHRLNDALIQFEKLFLISYTIGWGKFIPILILVILTMFDNHKNKIFNYLLVLWFGVPAVIYSFYSGTTSEYYMLLSAPIVIYIMIYFQKKFIQILSLYNLNKAAIIISTIVWVLYGYIASSGHWIKSPYGGLNKQKDEVRKIMNDGGTIGYNEGDIKAYIFQVYMDNSRKITK